MWHVVHLIARPIEALLGLFCLLTAILLYPDQEGMIQSKFEDFWIRVHDYQKLALSKHAAFITQIAKLETEFLDRIFGQRIVSVQAVVVSSCCSLLSFVVCVSPLIESAYVGEPDPKWPTWFAGLSAGSLIAGSACIFLPKSRRARATLVILGLLVVVGATLAYSHELGPTAFPVVVVLLTFGFGCDVVYVAVTRRLIRWAGEMTQSLRVVAVIALNLFLAAILIGPVFIKPIFNPENSIINIFAVLSTTNLFDGLLASLFGVLAAILLIHRALWPLLTRTLFRMADIGTKGRRAILTTVGLALLAAGISGKVPELVQKLIEKF